MSSSAAQEFDPNYVNPRGIPRVMFIENVGEFVKTKGTTVDTILRQFQEQYSKYKLMDHKLSQNKSQLAAKIPEISKTIDTVTFLNAKLVVEAFALTTHFGLTETCFAEATVSPQGTLHLWLGANVLVEYTFQEAQALLEKNLAAAKLNLSNTIEDLAWLRDQQTILEVNTARVYNFDVEQRRNASKAGTTA